MTKRGCSWKAAGLAALLFGGSGLILGQAGPGTPPRLVEAERFILRDHKGHRRAELGLHDGGPSLALFDEKGQCRVRIAVHADGTSRLAFYDEKDKERGTVLVGPNGEPTFNLDGKDARSAARPAGSDSTPSLPASRPPIRPALLDASAAAEQARKAEPLYKQYCISCHAKDGQGARVRTRMPTIPDFTMSKWQASRGDAQLLACILDGRGKDMPPFSGELNTEQARALVALVRAFGPARATPAAASTDFDRRMEELQRRWDELDRQMRALTPAGRKS